jgi:hypothetical protein
MTEVVSLIGTFSDKNWWVLLVVIAVVIGYVLLVVCRTGSVYSLMDLTWRIFSKKDSDGDSELAKYMRARNEFMQFRFSVGVRVRTMEKANALIAWSEKHGEDIGEIAACGKYFDFEKIKLKDERELPQKKEKTLHKFGLLVVVFFVYLAILGVVYGRAVITIKSSGTVVYATAENVSLMPLDFFWKKQVFVHREDCKSEGLVSAFSRPDTKVVCELINTDGGRSFVDSALKSQRYLFGFILCVSFFVGYRTWRWLRIFEIISKMKNRLSSCQDKNVDASVQNVF